MTAVRVLWPDGSRFTASDAIATSPRRTVRYGPAARLSLPIRLLLPERTLHLLQSLKGNWK